MNSYIIYNITHNLRGSTTIWQTCCQIHMHARMHVSARVYGCRHAWLWWSSRPLWSSWSPWKQRQIPTGMQALCTDINEDAIRAPPVLQEVIHCPFHSVLAVLITVNGYDRGTSCGILRRRRCGPQQGHLRSGVTPPPTTTAVFRARQWPAGVFFSHKEDRKWQCSEKKKPLCGGKWYC